MKQCNRCGGVGEHTIDCILQSQEDYLKSRESLEKCSPYHGFLGQPQTQEQLKAMIEAAVLAEREACAKVCEEMIASVITKPMPLRDIVTAIRARSNNG